MIHQNDTQPDLDIYFLRFWKSNILKMIPQNDTQPDLDIYFLEFRTSEESTFI